MGLERIYFELKKREDDEYYVELAQKDVLLIPVLTDIMLNNSNSMSIWAQMILEKIKLHLWGGREEQTWDKGDFPYMDKWKNW